jgi:hypothetical protein
MQDFLKDVDAIDWSDLNTSAKCAERILRQLAADKELLRHLLLEVADNESLFSKCECHPLDDKIVIYDAMQEKNFRIRFRLATSYQDERPHTHRFSFTTLILRGVYYQTFYTSTNPLDDAIDVNAITPVYMREDQAGSAMTIDHSTIHSTIAAPDTISLLLRGPAVKDRAIITHKATGEVEWRIGAEQESMARRQQVQMSIQTYADWCKVIEAAGLI